MDRYPAMAVGWILMMDGFDLPFERVVFGGQLELTIDVLAVNSQGFSTHQLEPGAANRKSSWR
jgi:hypothetical protein